MASRPFIRSLRQLLLLTLLLIIAGSSYLSRARSTSWEEPLWVTVYPIAADEQQKTQRYIEKLDKKIFESIESFMQQEANRYNVEIQRPVRIDIGQPVKSMPPPPPADGNPFSVALWSMKLRWWASTETSDQPGATPDIQLFLVYHDPTMRSTIPHSLGLQKGMLGVVHVFADRSMQGENNVVITHEMLHTLGASDKYHPESNQPLFPIGYAEPDRIEAHPQRFAEIMAGRIPISESEAVMPNGLSRVRVGTETALEIRWQKPEQ